MLLHGTKRGGGGGGMTGVRLNNLKTHFREGEINEELIDEIVQQF